ncbi:MAG: FAD:protein FMN transferase [Chloroflexi bacterium]|nr:MAG: FAD:protein FMN transferase [Chloroflexota bacterium]
MSPELQTRHFDALGSTCELLSLGSGQAALERCERWVRDAEARFTRFLPDSELAGLNAGDGRYVPVSPELFAMLEAALWAFEGYRRSSQPVMTGHFARDWWSRRTSTH